MSQNLLSKSSMYIGAGLKIKTASSANGVGIKLLNKINGNNSNFNFSLITPILARYYSQIKIGSTMTFYTNRPGQLKKDPKDPFKLDNFSSDGRPLSIILSWLTAQDRGIEKYANIYLKEGFDCLSVKISPFELLWPKSYYPKARDQQVPFLHSLDHPKLIIHGFSVGAFCWTQFLKYIATDKKYGHIIKSVVGQVWDSPVTISGAGVGVSKAVLPNSPILQKTLQKLIELQILLLKPVVTKYYYEAKDYYYFKNVKCPALFFCGRNDVVSTMDFVDELQEVWNKEGIQSITTKSWEKSRHVAHLHKYPEEYKETLLEFLDTVLPERRQQKQKQQFYQEPLRISHEKEVREMRAEYGKA